MAAVSGDQRARLDTVALLGALCLFLASIEYIIPKPVPFMRLGLANLPVLLAVWLMDGRSVAAVVALKVVGQGLVQGTLFSYIVLFSAAGSIASAAVMFVAHRGLGRHISLLGLSVLGALASNLTQILAARLIVFGPSAWLLGPAFLITGTVAAILLGLFAQRFVEVSVWVAELQQRFGGGPNATGPTRERAG